MDIIHAEYESLYIEADLAPGETAIIFTWEELAFVNMVISGALMRAYGGSYPKEEIPMLEETFEHTKFPLNKKEFH